MACRDQGTSCEVVKSKSPFLYAVGSFVVKQPQMLEFSQSTAVSGSSVVHQPQTLEFQKATAAFACRWPEAALLPG